MSTVGLSVVMPVRDAAERIEPRIEGVVAALRGRAGFELLAVDDGSADGSDAVLARALGFYPELRVLRHRCRAGHSAALRSGIEAARGDWIATLDGDGRDDPADLARLLAAREAAPQAAVIAGCSRQRRHPFTRALARAGDRIRQQLLGDPLPDPGCGLALFRRDLFLALPPLAQLERVLPVLARRAGHPVLHVPVRRRPPSPDAVPPRPAERLRDGVDGLRAVAGIGRPAHGPGAREITLADLGTDR